MVQLSEEVEAALGRLAPSGRLLLALSGGADSVAALRLLLGLDREVTAAHFDHKLRSSSSADAAFVRDLCASLGVSLVEGSADVARIASERRWNVEAAARRLRYDFLHRAARDAGCQAIVVGHTRDDQAETFLLQALRGSAFPSGMPAKRGLVVRPLLGVGRGELREHLSELDQVWREDETNSDVERTRAWLRHEVLPVLARRFPSAPTRLAATAAVLRDADAAIEGLTAQLLGSGPLKVAALAAVPVAVQRTALARLVEDAGVEPSRDLIEKAREAAGRAAEDAAAGPWRTSLSGESFLRVAYGRVEIARRRDPVLPDPLAVNSVAELQRAISELGAHGVVLPEKGDVERWLAAHPSGLVLRHRLPGDQVRLPAGGKSLADLLVDRKLPLEDRDALLLLAAGSEVLWIEGVPTAPRSTTHISEHGKAAARSAETGPAARPWALALSDAEADLRHMRAALEQAAAAAAAGELPVGAVVVRDGAVLAASGNRTEADEDPSAHAELLAIRRAAAAAGDWRLDGATLYVTLEPCPMCFGAVLQTRLERVVFAARNVREGALGSVMDLRYGAWKRRPVVEEGVLADESRQLLRAFFAARR